MKTGDKMEKRIYIVDDEENIRNLIGMFLAKEGFTIETFSDGNKMAVKFENEPADLLILDILMPAVDGYTLCSAIRKKSKVPIIFVSARDTEVDRIAGFMLGADDYMTKPFSPMELVMRVKALFNRVAREPDTREGKPLCYGNLMIDLKQRKAASGNNDIALTYLELDLLAYLTERAGCAVSRDELLEQVWKFKAETETRATDDTVKRLRKKLESTGADIQIDTVWGYGFKLTKKV
jgi:DNA-binding response OmpR family regulator